MKNATIFHGTDCKPEDEHYWYAWLKSELEAANFTVALPDNPDINHEPIDSFLPTIMKDLQTDSDTVLIGHSAGAPLILSILEQLDTPIAKAILVAGYSMRLPDQKRDPVLQENYDWDKIKSNCQEFVFVNSVDDPWGCDAEQGRLLFDKLGGTQIIRNEGHFGSVSRNQIYTKFPLVRDLALEAVA